MFLFKNEKLHTVCGLCGHTNMRKNRIYWVWRVYIRSEYTMLIGKIYAYWLIQLHKCMKPHRNHADSENISAYSDIPKAYMRISAWNHICGICMASYIIWAMCRLELSDKLSYCSFWGQKLGKNCACCDICKFAIKVHKRFEIG